MVARSAALRAVLEKRAVSPRRPAQGTATQDMQVEVKHRLPSASAVVDCKAERIAAAKLFRNLARSQHEVTKERLVFSCGITKARNRFARDQQHMHRCSGIDVLERDALVIFINNAGRDLACDDFFEEGLGHGCFRLW